VSDFLTAFNFGNAAFGASCSETFVVAKNGNPGEYAAINIEDMEGSSLVAPGGLNGDNNIILFVTRTVVATARIEEGTILVVRSKRVRVKSITDEGDDTLVINCGTAGVKL
jgi:hypothetical protein